MHRKACVARRALRQLLSSARALKPVVEQPIGYDKSLVSDQPQPPKGSKLAKMHPSARSPLQVPKIFSAVDVEIGINHSSCA